MGVREGLLKHFGIVNPFPFVDVEMSALSGKMELNLIELDKYLMRVHEDYVDGISMEDIIKKHYGEAAFAFVLAEVSE